MTLEQVSKRIEVLEKKQEKLINTIKKLKGLNMAEFDFDSLLDELDEETETTEKTETINTSKTEETNEEDGQNIDDLIDLNNNVLDSNNDTGSSDRSNTDSVPEVDYKELYEQLKREKEELEKQLKTVKIAKDNQEIEKVTETKIPDILDEDIVQRTKSFLKDYNEIQLDKLELRDREKELKEAYNKEGVNIKAAIKAWKEYQKQIKETPDEALEVEYLKDVIAKDESISSTIIALSE